GISRDARGDAADRLALELGIGEVDLAEIGHPRRRELALGIAAHLQQILGGGAVEQAGIHMGQAEMRGERPGDRALAACRGAIDGDDHVSCLRSHRRSVARNASGLSFGIEWAASSLTANEAPGTRSAKPARVAGRASSYWPVTNRVRAP